MFLLLLHNEFTYKGNTAGTRLTPRMNLANSIEAISSVVGVVHPKLGHYCNLLIVFGL